MIAPQFFTAAGIGAAASGVSALGGLFGGGGKQTHIDDSAVRQQMQAKSIAASQQAQAANLAQRSAEVNLKAQNDATRQRVEALDRIVGTFQQNLRI